MIALPTGDSFESLFSAGFASAEPTMWYSKVCFAATSRSRTVEPTETVSLEISKDTVSVGSTVRLRDVAAKQTFEYHIVGSAEANPAENKLSNESPVGKAIMGKKKGDVVEVAAPRGSLKFKILEIKAA